MLPTHALAAADLRRLAAGSAGRPMVQALARTQYTRNVLLLRYVLDRLSAGVRAPSAVPVLIAASEADRDAFADLLLEPMIGAWLSTTAARLAAGTRDTGEEHLAAVATVAAARCRLDADLDVSTAHGVLHLPTLGVARAEHETTAVRVRDGHLRTGDRDEWQSVRTLLADPPLVLDDLDAHRNIFEVQPASRLSADAFEHWHTIARAGWDLLTEAVPARAAELAGAMRVVVPLTDDRAGRSRSITARQAFGAFGLTRPESMVDFAATLIHEFQHSKLNAVLDLVPLDDGSDTRTFFAPWRPDPRPLPGLLHGIYAFLGIAQCWRDLRAVDRLATDAEHRLAETRLWVAAALDQLQASPALTAAGQEFTAGLRQGLDELLEVDLPQTAVASGERSLRQLRQEWELRNER